MLVNSQSPLPYPSLKESPTSPEQIEPSAKMLIGQVSQLSKSILLEQRGYEWTEPEGLASNFHIQSGEKPSLEFGALFQGHLDSMKEFPVIDYGRAKVMSEDDLASVQAAQAEVEKKAKELEPLMIAEDSARINLFTIQCQDWIHHRCVEGIFHKLEESEDEQKIEELLLSLQAGYEQGGRIRMGYAEGEVTKKIVGRLAGLQQTSLIVSMAEKRWLNPRYAIYALSRQNGQRSKEALAEILKFPDLLSKADIESFINMKAVSNDALIADVLKYQGRSYLKGLTKDERDLLFFELFTSGRDQSSYMVADDIIDKVLELDATSIKSTMEESEWLDARYIVYALWMNGSEDASRVRLEILKTPGLFEGKHIQSLLGLAKGKHEQLIKEVLTHQGETYLEYLSKDQRDLLFLELYLSDCDLCYRLFGKKVVDGLVNEGGSSDFTVIEWLSPRYIVLAVSLMPTKPPEGLLRHFLTTPNLFQGKDIELFVKMLEQQNDGLIAKVLEVQAESYLQTLDKDDLEDMSESLRDKQCYASAKVVEEHTDRREFKKSVDDMLQLIDVDEDLALEQIQDGAFDLHTQDEEGNTLLHRCVEDDDFLTVRNLLELNAPLHVKNKLGLTPEDLIRKRISNAVGEAEIRQLESLLGRIEGIKLSSS